MSTVRPEWNLIDHVLLDMDGTILDLSFDSFFWKHLLPERYAHLRGLSIETAREELQPWFSEVEHTLPWYCIDHWSARTGLDLPAMKREHRDRIAPLPGSLDFLEAVRGSGRELWLVTNAHEHSWRLKLEHTGLHGHFDQIICSHDFGVPKEDPRFWQRLREAHPFEPRRALFADDSPRVIQAAIDYGIGQVYAIGCPDSGEPRRQHEGFEVVDGLIDLLPID